jgi:tetratricopeptide (TPR) repeat protein
VLGTINDRSYYPTVVLRLADCLYEQGRHEEVEDLCKQAREKTGAADLVNFVLLDALEGCLLAHRGDPAEAMERALRAVEVANATEFFEARLLARVYLAEVLVLADRCDEARDRALSALAVAEAKGDVAIGIRLRERFAGLAIEVV